MMLKRGICLLIDVFEERVFDRGVQNPSEERLRREVKTTTLLPPLSDEIVLERIWPLLHKRVNMSLLWRLRRVSRAWRESVARSTEWAALEVVRVDTSGLNMYLEKRRERRPPLQERVEDKLRFLSVLLLENLMDLSSESAGRQLVKDNSRRSEKSWSSSGSLVECACVEAGIPYTGEFLDYSESECELCEEIGSDEVWSPSTEDTLRVYFPLHSVRA